MENRKTVRLTIWDERGEREGETDRGRERGREKGRGGEEQRRKFPWEIIDGKT